MKPQSLQFNLCKDKHSFLIAHVFCVLFVLFIVKRHSIVICE